MYWKQARREFPGIERMDNTTQSVVLSLAINYGTGAKALAALRDPIRRNDIGAVVAHLRRLEAGTKCKGLIRRRREERTMLELAVAGNTHQNGGAQVVFD
jgi:GH24 family phage-related lysozyme (muramidase)